MKLEQSEFPVLWQVMEHVYFIPMMTPSREDKLAAWEVPDKFAEKIPEFEKLIPILSAEEFDFVVYGDPKGNANATAPPTKDEPLVHELTKFLAEFFNDWEPLQW